MPYADFITWSYKNTFQVPGLIPGHQGYIKKVRRVGQKGHLPFSTNVKLGSNALAAEPDYIDVP
jgi:hypothetical protein